MQNNNYRRNNHHHRSSENNSERHERHDHQGHKKYNRGTILLKSTAFALFIVLITLSAAYVIVKNKKEGSVIPVQECSKKAIQIPHAIEKFEVKDGSIFLLTKVDKAGKQELVKLDGRCHNESSRVVFQANSVEAAK